MRQERGIVLFIAILACFISVTSGMAQHVRSEEGRINPEEHQLEIFNLNAPTHLEAGRRLDVSITAVDARGVGFVEVQFRDEVRRLEAGNQRIANFALSFETGRTGFDQIRAKAFASDGRT